MNVTGLKRLLLVATVIWAGLVLYVMFEEVGYPKKRSAGSSVSVNFITQELPRESYLILAHSFDKDYKRVPIKVGSLVEHTYKVKAGTTDAQIKKLKTDYAITKYELMEKFQDLYDSKYIEEQEIF